MSILAHLVVVVMLGQTAEAKEPNCVACHRKVTPGIVNDWKQGAHADSDVACMVGHGKEHTSPKNVEKVRIPTPETCAECHEEQVEQFKEGKHALGWKSMKAMPTAHWQPMALMDGMKGCGGRHKIGLKTEAEIKALKKDGAGFGVVHLSAICWATAVFRFR